MSQRFSDFVNRMLEEAKTAKPGFDPVKRIESYRRHVYALYADIDRWLSEGLESGNVKTGQVAVSITEENLGMYSIDLKWIQIGLARIEFSPVGTILIGTKARVDVSYKSRKVMLIRIGENVLSPYETRCVDPDGNSSRRKTSGKTIWKYVAHNPKISYVSLNQDSFEDLIINLVEGQ